ncbi:hypothetical protein ROZALSC1DRAFT_20444 [Rozella allomycis CSF55]|nr:hypothetical protein ROZALSC1DRAFT_20444 [Rozella allomycis CSF55]
MSVQSDSLSPNPFEVLAMACQYQSRQDRFLRKDILPSTISDDPELSEAFNAALAEASKISEIRTERNWRSAEEWASIFEAQTKSQTSSPYSKSSRKNKRLKRNEDIALHCVCQTKYDPRKFMIACDKCNG